VPSKIVVSVFPLLEAYPAWLALRETVAKIPLRTPPLAAAANSTISALPSVDLHLEEFLKHLEHADVLLSALAYSLPFQGQLKLNDHGLLPFHWNQSLHPVIYSPPKWTGIA
jgi:hypothetical protein